MEHEQRRTISLPPLTGTLLTAEIARHLALRELESDIIAAAEVSVPPHLDCIRDWLMLKFKTDT